MKNLNEIKYFPSGLLEKIFNQKKMFSNLDIIGYSVLNNPIYRLRIGKGIKRILIWSQMHGNETTTTKSLIDFYDFLINDKVGKDLSAHLLFSIIFQLNPDGSNRFSRNNHNNYDLNRDALNLSQPESKTLMKEFEVFKPNFCFNLHGQRSIYSIGKSTIPASISFLSPSTSKNKILTKSRLISMRLIVGVCDYIKSKYSLVYGRFDDSFNLNCFGDFFTKKRIPTILFEAGHFYNDKYRKFSRELVLQSLIKISLLIKNESYKQIDYKKYYKIESNNDNLRDIIIKNVTILKNNKLFFAQEIAIQYSEKLVKNKVLFIPLIDSIAKKLHYESSLIFELNDNQSQKNILKSKIGENAEKFINKLNLLNNI